MDPSSEISIYRAKSMNIFKKLKSDYFLQKLFNNLSKKKSLDIIKYNKNLKNRINFIFFLNFFINIKILIKFPF